MKRRELSPAERAERAAAFKALRATARDWRHDPARLRQAAGVVNVDGRTLSEYNALLLLVQAHGRGIALSTVGGFRQWHAHGRHVRKGEKGLIILFPMRVKSADPSEPGAAPEDVTKFRRVLVWDISQTDPGAGRPGAPAPDDDDYTTEPTTAPEPAPTTEPAPAAGTVPEPPDVWTPAPAADPVASILSNLFN